MERLADRLLGLSPADLDAALTATGTADLAAGLAGSTDTDLQRLLDDDRVRERVVGALVAGLAELTDPARRAGITGTVRFELSRPGAPDDRRTVRFEDGAVVPRLDHPPADVVIEAAAVDVVRLMTGQAHAALLYLGGRLRVAGDERLALDVGSAFVVPGSGTGIADPTVLDPVDVATAVAAAPPSHLQTVMGGGFRSVVLDEVTRRFPDFLDQVRARRVRLGVVFEVGGRPGGGVDRFLVRVDHGSCTVVVDPPPDEPRDATVGAAGADFLLLAVGQLNPVTALLRGTLVVTGDRLKALALNTVMRPPRPRT